MIAMTADPTKSKRRWFQFRLRALLIAVAVVAVPMAWVGWQLDWIRERRWVLDGKHNLVERYVRSDDTYGGLPVKAPGYLGFFGETGIAIIVCGEQSKEDINRVLELFPEANVGYIPIGSQSLVVLPED